MRVERHVEVPTGEHFSVTYLGKSVASWWLAAACCFFIARFFFSALLHGAAHLNGAPQTRAHASARERTRAHASARERTRANASARERTRMDAPGPGVEKFEGKYADSDRHRPFCVASVPA